MEGKLLKDAIVSEVVDLGKRTLFDGSLSESELKRLLSKGGCFICESNMHKYPKFDLGAKVRISKVRQGFCDLICCA